MSRIMIVDDEPYIRDLWVRILEDQDFELVQCQNGLEAADYYQEHFQEVDLIILDMQMPHLGGFEAFRRFKKINDQVTCIVTTGYLIEEKAQMMLNDQNVSFLNKPFRPNEGLEAILEALDK